MRVKLGKVFIFCAEGFALSIAILAGLVFFAHWKLSHGGMSLNILSGRIANAFETRLSTGTQIDIGNLRLVRDAQGKSGAGPLRVLVEDFVVTDPKDQELISLPQIAFQLRTSDVIRGNIMPRYVDISGAVVTFTRTREGQIDFGIIRNGEEGASAASDKNFLEATLGKGASPLSDTLFEGAILSDTTVTFVDEFTGQMWEAAGAKAEIWQTSAGYEMSLDAPFRVDDEEAWVRVNGQLNERREQISMRITTQAAPLSNMVSLIAGTSFGERIAASLSGSIEATSDFTGRILSSDINLQIGEGNLTLGDETIPFEYVDLAGQYLPQRRTFNIDGLDYAVSGNEGRLNGYVSLGEIIQGLEPEKIDFDLEAIDLVVDLPAILPQALSLAQGRYKGHYQVEDRHLVFDTLSTDFFGEIISGSLEILFPLEEGQSTGVIADASVTGSLTTDQVLRGWPLVLAPPAREWVVEQIAAGRVSQVDYVMDMPRGAIRPETPLDDDMLKLTFSFDQTTAYYVPGMTPMTNASGNAVLTGNSFFLSADSAQINTISVSGGEVDIPAFMPKGGPSYYRASIEGDMQEMLALIDEEPLRFMEQAGFAPERFSGRGTFDLELMRPQLTFVPMENYEFSGNGTFQDATIQDMIADIDVEAATGTLSLSTDGLTVEGNAQVSGLPVEYSWSRSFEDVPDIRLVANGILNAQSGDNLGVSFRQYMQGQVRYSVEAHQTGDVYEKVDLTADLTDAQILLDMVNYAKPSGQRGEVQVSLRPPSLERPLWNVDTFKLDTEDLDLFGSVILEETGRLIEARINRLYIRDRADLRMEVQRDTEGGVSANLTGAYANIDLFGDSLFDRAGSSDEEPSILPETMRFSVELDNLALKKDVLVKDYDALLARTGGTLGDISMSGEFAKGGSFIVMLDPSSRNIGRELVAETDNLGAVAAGLFDIESIQGGTAAYKATLLTDGPVAGTLSAGNFRVVDAPLIARILSAGSLTGLSDILNGEGIEFTEVSADIQYQDSEMTIIDARATGPSVGVSVAGDVDFAENLFDVNGAVAPAYGVNSMLGNIPGFGELFVSRKGEGIVAFSYMINGPVDGPTVTVNALSLFAPGIFRRIFEPIRQEQMTSAQLLDQAVQAAEEQGGIPQRRFTATQDQMRMLSDSLEVFRLQLSAKAAVSVGGGATAE